MSITSYDPTTTDVPELDTTGPLPKWVALLVPASQLADRLAETEFVPTAMRGRPAAVTACILYGAEIGIGPMQALRSIAVINGQPTPSAELLRAMIFTAGHEMWVVEASGTRVTVGGRRADSPREHTVTWTSEMARQAGLSGRDTWKKWPRAMLMARATSELARSIFPDAIRGLGHLDDVADVPVMDLPDDDTAATNVRTVRRRKRTMEPAAIDAAPAATMDDAPPSPTTGDAPSGQDPTTTRPDPATTAGAATTDDQPMGYTGAITVNRDQLARMNIAFRELGVEDRDTRLRMASGVVGRRLTSSTELTKDEASKVITALDDAQQLGIPVPVWPADPDDVP